ncbi:heat shock protein HtpX [Natronobacterium gregoryi SP2]|uniref:Heat shock protein HtpX n=1 Tax=Natronobacterium gregoryi (strain ATCC 43098 / DSM 3393 / CCM 3738 / CIP 104747 / IAM 13177 / JCM 8860 / NBRC 102187 / NCIMB 2189 / SP2) TaxID=797304 RepID=L9XMN5_NATGS|nr:heat shock protein HtpX [Natronobacterium gregoryi SP2]
MVERSARPPVVPVQRLRTTFGLWSRLALATVVATLAFGVLLVLEFAMATVMAGMMMILLPVLAVSLAVFAIVGALLVGSWLVLAVAYRRLHPSPLIAGRIAHDGMADAVEPVAYQLTHPDDFLRAFVRAGGRLLGILFLVVLTLGGGAAAIEASPRLTVERVAVAAGIATVIATTIAVVDAEIRDGATVERTLADRARVCEAERSGESASDDDSTVEDLQQRVDRLAAQTTVPSPTVRLGEARTPIAASVGYRPATSSIVVSRGLVERLSDRELEAVLAHELAHIVNRDAAVLTALSLPAAKAEPFLEDAPEPASLYVGQIGVFVSVAAVPIAVVTRLAVALVARYREYVADQAAIVITGDPAALASALETLDRDLVSRPSSDLREHRSTAAFSIVPPPWEEHRFFDRTRRFVSRTLLGTHPSTEKRVERLRARV